METSDWCVLSRFCQRWDVGQRGACFHLMSSEHLTALTKHRTLCVSNNRRPCRVFLTYLEVGHLRSDAGRSYFLIALKFLFIKLVSHTVSPEETARRFRSPEVLQHGTRGRFVTVNPLSGKT